MKRSVLLLCVSLAYLARAEAPTPPPLPPPEPAGQAWSVVGARTLEPNANGVEISIGYPGLAGSYLRGVAPGVNLGGKLGVNYGLQGLVRQSVLGVGLSLQGLVKVRFFDADKLSLGLTFEPGPFFSSRYNVVAAGFALPLELRLGIAASSAIGLAIVVGLPLWISIGEYYPVYLPILTGVGLEYFVTSKLALLFRTRMGPTLHLGTIVAAEFTFNGELGVAFKL
jgi:hypothetical protein